MVDAEDYVDGHTVRFDLLVSTMITSLILSVYGTAAGIVEELASMPALLLTTLFDGIASILTTTLAQPTATLELAWATAADSLPNVGPLTFVVALVVVALTWRAQLWVIRRITEGT